MNPDFIQKLTSIIETNLHNENFGPEQLVEKLGISHSTLHRRLKKTTGNTISQVIRDIRLEKAKTLLLNDDSTISEIAYKVGFGSVTYFNRCFHEYFGCAPGEYKKLELHKIIKDKNQKKNIKNRTVIIVFSVIILITGFILLNKFHVLSSKNPKEKSIAVIPFSFASENTDKDYMYKAVEDNISRNLSKIAELRVVAIYQTENTNLEKIRNHLNVEYFLNGTIHQKSRNCQLVLKLINSRNNRLEWSESFTLFDQDNLPTESEITLAIARELNIEVKEEERLLIGRRLTIDPNANDFYEMGRYAHLEYLLNNAKKDALQKAEYYYKKSLLYDPSFAESYAGLARVAYDRTTWSDVFKLTYLDTVMSLANKALSLDSTLADAYIIRGDYYRERIPSQAVCEYEQALRYDPNNWQAYSGLARYYLVRDNIKSVEYFFESAKRYRGPEYELVLNWLAFQFRIYGLFEQAEYFNKLKLEWDNDSIQYYLGMAAIEHYQEHYENANELALKAYAIDSNDININGLLGFNFVLLKDYKNAIYHYQKTLDLAATMNYKQNNEHHRLGYAYLLRGDISKANEYFNLQIKACDTLLSRNNQDIPAQYDLAATYAILGQKDKAYENLRMFNKEESIQWFLYFYMKNDPLLETIRNEPEFQQIFKEVKQKATATRDKLKAWVDQQKNI